MFQVQGNTPIRLPRAPQVCYAGNAMVERERLLLPEPELSRPARMLARGGHLWLFLAEAVTGREARVFGEGLLAVHRIEQVPPTPPPSVPSASFHRTYLVKRDNYRILS
jgi:hypothetical protein